MATDEQARVIFYNKILYTRCIPARITTDMSYKNIHFFAGKEKVFGVNIANALIINIAVNAPEWLKGSQFFSKTCCAEISAMPYFIAVFEMCKNSFVQVVVGI